MNRSNNLLKGVSTSVNQSIRSNTNPSPNSNNGSMVTHTNNNNNIQNNNVDRTGTNTMNMEAKLHHVAGSFRQKRDDAYRQQQLAFERRKLVDEELTAANQTVQDLHAKSKHLQNQAGCNPAAKEELNGLRATVTKLVHEVRNFVFIFLYFYLVIGRKTKAILLKRLTLTLVLFYYYYSFYLYTII